MEGSLMSQLNLEQQRKRAKDLHRAHSRGVPEAAMRIAQYVPRLHGLSPEQVLAAEFSLSEAQHVIAQEAGFSSWPKLKHELESRQSVFSGSWVVNVASSLQHPLNPFRSATLQINVSGDTFTIEHAMVDAAGREERATSVMHVDGAGHASGNSGHVGLATWLDRRKVEVIDKLGGEIVGRGIYEVSPDGETLRIHSAEQTLVLDKKQAR